MECRVAWRRRGGCLPSYPVGVKGAALPDGGGRGGQCDGAQAGERQGGLEAEGGLPTQRAQEGGQGAASPGGGGRPPRGVFGGLVGRIARAVRDGEWRVALVGMCHMLEAAGVQQHSEEQYLVNVTRVVGGWQATVTVPMVELIVAGDVASIAADAIEAAVKEAFFDLFGSVWAQDYSIQQEPVGVQGPRQEGGQAAESGP